MDLSVYSCLGRKSHGCADICPLVPQGDYDQSKTKILHLAVNPASEARQGLRQDQARLQEECERLRTLLSALERGGPVPAGLEASCLPSSKEVAGRPSLSLTASGVACASVHPSCAGSQAKGGPGPSIAGAVQRMTESSSGGSGQIRG